MTDEPVVPTSAHTWERIDDPVADAHAYGLDDDTIGGAVVIFLTIVAISLLVGFLLGWWIT